MKIAQKNRRFVNIVEITNFSPNGNTVKTVGTYIGKDYNEAHLAFDYLKTLEEFKHSRFSIQLNDYDVRLIYPMR